MSGSLEKLALGPGGPVEVDGRAGNLLFVQDIPPPPFFKCVFDHLAIV